MEPEQDDLCQDGWFLKPRASNDMELTRDSFKAFGRLLILKFDMSAGEIENLEQGKDEEIFKP